jgi:hypothetical protein
LEQSPSTRVPDNRGAWLTAVARRRYVDGVRRQVSFERKAFQIAREFTEAVAQLRSEEVSWGASGVCGRVRRHLGRETHDRIGTKRTENVHFSPYVPNAAPRGLSPGAACGLEAVSRFDHEARCWGIGTY